MNDMQEQQKSSEEISHQRYRQAMEEYRAEQAKFTDIRGEINRLRSAASALEAEASEINAQWKAQTRERHVDHRKTNSLITREVELKQQAETMHKIADAREEILPELVLRIAELRPAAISAADLANEVFLKSRMDEILSDANFSGKVRELLSLCEAEAEWRNVKRESFSITVGSEKARSLEPNPTYSARGIFQKMIGKISSGSAVSLPAIPPAPIRGEIIALTPIALKNLREAGGVMPPDDGWPKTGRATLIQVK